MQHEANRIFSGREAVRSPEMRFKKRRICCYPNTESGNCAWINHVYGTLFLSFEPLIFSMSVNDGKSVIFL